MRDLVKKLHQRWLTGDSGVVFRQYWHERKERQRQRERDLVWLGHSSSAASAQLRNKIMIFGSGCWSVGQKAQAPLLLGIFLETLMLVGVEERSSLIPPGSAPDPVSSVSWAVGSLDPQPRTSGSSLSAAKPFRQKRKYFTVLCKAFVFLTRRSVGRARTRVLPAHTRRLNHYKTIISV